MILMEKVVIPLDKENNSSLKGFTLIELSIVLVIIGLIVGGVLVGRDLIASAATRQQIAQIEKINTAVNTFRGKFEEIPGDISLSNAIRLGFVTASCSGGPGQRDGNGVIEGAQAPASPYSQDGGETALMWLDLGAEKLIDFIPVFALTCGSGVTNYPATGMPQFFPSAKLGNNNYLYPYGYNGHNWLGIAVFGGFDGASNLIASANIAVKIAYNMDKKVDDGIPTTESR